ncbi:proline-rich receptor-like protein kinase PERK9 [Papaver somniferum]|uniref:proline-rich receptor-like protein kinase PERK9 n=1 Tax=Papaver somniferum TaxID=3469 RepID=UPI000E703B7D|nr:proline-rich receptor-like protein kinase PERK9 [Papaver somniferum]
MADRHRVPYQTPPSSPYRSPYRSPDISPPKDGPPRPSPPDPRAQKVPSSSGPRVSITKKGDPPKGSQYAVNRPVDNPSSQRADPMGVQQPSPQRTEPLNVHPLQSLPPQTSMQSRPRASQSIPLVKESSSKSTMPLADPPRNPPVKRKCSDLNLPKAKKPLVNEPGDSDVFQMIRNISVGKKKVTFKHVDLEAFKKKHGLEAFDVKFFAQDDDLTYHMIVNYKYDEFHLLTTMGAFEAGLMLLLYSSVILSIMTFWPIAKVPLIILIVVRWFS